MYLAARPRVIVILALAVGVSSSFAGASEIGPVAFLLPPEGATQDYGAFAENLARATGLEPEYVLGPGTPNALETRMEDDHTFVVSWLDPVSSDGRRIEVKQVVRETRPDGNHEVAPADLHQGVEVWAGGILARLTAPPGVFSQSGGGLSETAEVLARSMGIPPADASAWTSLSSSEADPVRLLQEAAPTVPGFYLACECTILTRHAEGLSPNLNLVRVVFTAQGDPVVIELSPWVDLGRSQRLSEEQASNLLREGLQQRGADPQAVEFERIELDFDSARLVYEWRVRNEDTTSNLVNQDAHDGTIREVLTQETPVLPENGTSPPRTVPAPTGLAIGALVVVAWAWSTRERIRP